MEGMTAMRGWTAMPLVGVLAGLSGMSRSAEPAADLSPIVVPATRGAVSSFNVPASVDVADQAEIQNGQLEENISESLMTVPGVSARNRENSAQDQQLPMGGSGGPL